MKFLIITNLYEPYARGGAEAVVKTQAQELQKRGHDVVVLTAGPFKYGLWPKEEVIDGIRVRRFFPLDFYFVGHDYKFPKWLRVLARLIDTVNITSAWVVGDVVDQEKPDVVITHNLVGLGLLTPWALRCEQVKKHLHVLHDVQLVHPSGLLIYGDEARAERFTPRQIYEWITKHVFGSPSVIISPSKWLLDLHLEKDFFLETPIKEVISNPVLCSTEPRTERARGDKLKILYAGQLEKHKGIDWLLGVLEKRKQKREKSLQRGGEREENFILEIAGAGSLENKIRQASQKNPDQIIFHSKLNQKDLFRKLNEVDVLVVPSLCYENSPQIIAQANCVGLPVVASRIGGIPELVKDGENGFLFTPGDENSFTEALEKIQNLDNYIPIKTLSLDEYIDKTLKLCDNRHGV